MCACMCMQQLEGTWDSLVEIRKASQILQLRENLLNRNYTMKPESCFANDFSIFPSPSLSSYTVSFFYFLGQPKISPSLWHSQSSQHRGPSSLEGNLHTSRFLAVVLSSNLCPSTFWALGARSSSGVAHHFMSCTKHLSGSTPINRQPMKNHPNNGSCYEMILCHDCFWFRKHVCKYTR